MELFLFVINDKPGYRQTLSDAQAVLEDHFLNDRGVSQVQWGDEGRDRYGAHLWSTGVGWDERAPHTGQIIWPIEVPVREVNSKRLDPLLSEGAEMIMSVMTRNGKAQVIHRVSGDEWGDTSFRPTTIIEFATRAGQSLASHWNTKEST